MFDSNVVVKQLAAGVDALIELDLSLLDRDQLLELVRGVEAQRRRLPVVDHALVAEPDQRGVAGELAARDTRALLRDLLRLSPREAKARCAAALDVGPRRSLTGDALPPLLPVVAIAQADGVISPEHARVLGKTIEALPPALEAEHGVVLEARLVAEAARFDQNGLARIGRHLIDVLGPDGTLTDDAARGRRRHASLTALRDGSGELHATLAEAAGLLLVSDGLPPSGGTPATVLLTMPVDQLETRTGLATTAHGGTVSVAEALRLAGQAETIPVALGKAGILAYGHARRTASTGQRLALAARD